MGKTVKNPYLDTKHKGIKKHYKTGHYRARKKINGVDHKKTFANIRDAIQWRYTFNGIISVVGGHTIKKNSSKLAYVWSRFQDLHFPSLRLQTQKKMIQQYRLLQELEHFEMHEINSTLLSEWVIQKVEHFKLLQAEGKGSGVQARCSLDTELKILKQVFSWYKEEAEFDDESKDVFCPVKKRHYALGSIKKKVKRDKKIPPSDVLLLFENLEPLY